MPIDGTSLQTAVITAVRRLLRPLVRVLIGHDIGFPMLAELLKGVYLEVADRHFRLDKGRMTQSRLSMLTGVHRKDVKRLLEQPEAQTQIPRRVSLGARVIGLWTGIPLYLNEEGRPRPLANAEFEALAESVSKDLRPRTILDEWLRLNVVERVENEGTEPLLKLNADAFVPSEDQEELAYYFGRNLDDHIAAAGENLLGIGKPHLERAVYYPGLTQESVDELEALAREQATQALHTLNRAIQQRLEQDRGRDDAVHRFCFGAYTYQAEQGERGK